MEKQPKHTKLEANSKYKVPWSVPLFAFLAVATWAMNELADKHFDAFANRIHLCELYKSVIGIFN